MGKGMHTNYPKGTPLFIKLRTGETITGKFSDHKSGKVLLENGTSVNLADVRAMSIRKLTPTTKPKSTKKMIFRINK